MKAATPLSFAPGPTMLHPCVPAELEAMVADGYLSENHRGPAVVREVARTGEALRALLGIPADYRILYVGSATEAMERILAGGIVGHSQHLVQGAFARRFRDVAENQGVRNSWTEVPDGMSFRAGDLELDDRADLLALTQNETSTGARIPPDELDRMARAARSAGMLVAVDLVTGWPTEPVAIEALDAAFFSVQKGFGLPAGLGVLVVSPVMVERAMEAEARGTPPGGYLHLAALARAATRNETVATPNTLAIRLLGRVAEAYLARGGQSALAREAEAHLHDWNEVVRDHPLLELFVTDSDLQSRTVAVVRVTPPEAAPVLRSRLREQGLLVGDGYGPWKSKHLRVAHFPVQTASHLAQLRQALHNLYPLPPFQP
jgi:phosphoserine aminotransferase